MTRLIFWRLVQLPVLLLVIYTLTFVLAWMIPGNPLSLNDSRRPDKASREGQPPPSAAGRSRSSFQTPPSRTTR